MLSEDERGAIETQTITEDADDVDEVSEPPRAATVFDTKIEHNVEAADSDDEVEVEVVVAPAPAPKKKVVKKAAPVEATADVAPKKKVVKKKKAVEAVAEA